MKNKRFLFVATALLLSLFLPEIANATQLTQAGVRLGRLSISTTPDLLVTFKLNTTPTSVAKILVCLPTGFTTTSGTPATGTTFPNTPASITAPPGLPGTATTAVGAGGCPGGSVLVAGLTSASLNNTTLYGFTVASGNITNPSSSGQYNVTVSSQNSGGTTIDTTTTPVYITSSGGDQVLVTASVAPNFSFSLSSNADSTTTAADPSTSQDTTGVTMNVATNSPLGYTAYVKSGQGYLSSPETSTHITTGTFDGTADTITHPTSVMYGFIPTTGTPAGTATGTITYDGEYSDGAGGPISAANKAGSFNSTNFSSFESRNGYTSGDQITLKERVAVNSAIGYANDYTDTLTIVAAGNF